MFLLLLGVLSSFDLAEAQPKTSPQLRSGSRRIHAASRLAGSELPSYSRRSWASLRRPSRPSPGFGVHPSRIHTDLGRMVAPAGMFGGIEREGERQRRGQSGRRGKVALPPAAVVPGVIPVLDSGESEGLSSSVLDGNKEGDLKALSSYERHLHEAKLLTRNIQPRLSKLQTRITKLQSASYMGIFFGLTYGFCSAINIMKNLKLLSREETERKTIKIVGKIADILLRIIPFFELEVFGQEYLNRQNTDSQPRIWVSNHVSEVDILIFLVLAGRFGMKNGGRPIKILYWKSLEKYPLLRLFLKTAGMIPVDMENTGYEVDNKYKLESIKSMMKLMSKAIEEGFDVAILPEGRRNPDAPTLAKAFPGAYRLSKKHKVPINLIGTHGVEQFWNVEDGLHARSRKISIKCWPTATYESQDAFMEAFYDNLGHWAVAKKDIQECA